jgi:hypothetical protein
VENPLRVALTPAVSAAWRYLVRETHLAVRKMLSRSSRQISLNLFKGSGSRLLDRASLASRRSSMLGSREISTIARSTDSAPADQVLLVAAERDVVVDIGVQ